MIKNILDKIFARSGKVINVTQYKVTAKISGVFVGEICYIISKNNKIKAEVVNVVKNTAELMLYSQADGVKAGDRVVTTGKPLLIPVGMNILGREINGIGEFLDEKQINGFEYLPQKSYLGTSIDKKSPDTLLETGIKAIDTFIPIAYGQKIAVFHGRALGQNTFAQMVVNLSQEICIFVCTVFDEVHKTEISEGFTQKDNVVIILDKITDAPAKRANVIYTAVFMAEYFRKHHYNVLLYFRNFNDNFEALKHYLLLKGATYNSNTNSIALKQEICGLFERLGKIGDFNNSSITTIVQYDTSNSDLDSPDITLVRDVTEGHIFLSRRMAENDVYPTIDVLFSISRYSSVLNQDNRITLENEVRKYLNIYNENEKFILSGEYTCGNDEELDRAVKLKPLIDDFIRQRTYDRFDYHQILQILSDILESV